MRTDNLTIRVSLDLTERGAKNIVIHASTPEARDQAIERLRAVLPQLELLESALQAEVSE
jgi:hypothetical protein